MTAVSDRFYRDEINVDSTVAGHYWFAVFLHSLHGQEVDFDGGAPGRELDMKQMLIWGNVVSAEHARRNSGEAPDLVPNTCEPVRQRPGFDAEVLARGVLTYDIGADGSIVYTNGSAIFLRDVSGQPTRVLAESMIERVAMLDRVAKQ